MDGPDGDREGAKPGAVVGSGFRAWAWGLVGIHLLLGLVLYEPTLFPGGDNAGYMILGEALRSGEGYRDLYLPASPVHTKYPPLYPAILALLGTVGGLQLFKLASLALTAAAVRLTAELGRRTAGAAAGLAAAALVAVNPVLLEYGHYVLSEAPFVALTLLALVLLGSAGAVEGDRTGRGEEAVEREDGAGGPGLRAGPGRTAFLLGLAAAAAAFLTRTAGLPLLVAATLAPLLDRRWRRAAAAAAVGGATAVGWGVFQRLAAPERAGYLEELVLRNPYEPAAGKVGLADLLARGATNAWTYVSDVLPGALAGIDPVAGDGGAVPAALGTLVAGLALGGWAARTIRRPGPVELFALLYGGLIALWPDVWTDRRFLLPLLPLVLLYAALGTRRGAVALAARRGRASKEASRRDGGARGGGRGRAGLYAVVGLAAVLGLPGLFHDLSLAPDRIACVAAYRTGAPCDPPAFASFYAAARWAGENTEPGAVVANRKPRLFYWHSGRQGDVYRYSSEPRLVLGGLEEMGADYVVVDRVSGTTVRYLLPAIEAFRNRFEVVYAEGEPPTPILRFRRSAGIAGLRGGAD